MQVRCFRRSRWDRVALNQKRRALMTQSSPTQASPTLSLSAWRLSAPGVTVLVCQFFGFHLRFLHSISCRSGFGAWIAVRYFYVHDLSRHGLPQVFELRPSYSFNTTAHDQPVIDCKYAMGRRQLPSTATLHRLEPADLTHADFHHTRGHKEARD